MSPSFVRTKPLQAGKLLAIVAVVLFSAGSVFGVIPEQGLTGLFAVPILALGLVLVVAGETAVAGVRAIGASEPLTEQLTARPLYSVVRGLEVLGVVGAVVGFVVVIELLPDGPMAGPGAIGLLFVVAGIALLVLAGSLLRTLVEYYRHRHRGSN